MASVVRLFMTTLILSFQSLWLHTLSVGMTDERVGIHPVQMIAIKAGGVS